MSSTSVSTGNHTQNMAFALLKQTPVALTVYQGKDFKVVIANQMSLNIWGKAEADVLGKSLLEISPELAGSGAYKAAQNVLETGESFKATELLIRYEKEGRLHEGYFDVMYTVWQDEAGVNLGVITIATEVSHAVANRKVLEESEERFRATFENAAVGIAHVDLNGDWLMVNSRLCEIVGYSKEELLTCAFQDITHPDDLSKDLESLQELLAGRIQTYSMEKRYFRKNGSIVWVELTVSMIRDKQNRPKYFISVVKDISKRKETEAALQKSESFNRVVLEGSPDCIKLLDEEGRLQYINSNGLGHLEIEDFISYSNKYWWELWNQENQAKVRETLEKALKEGKAHFQGATATAKGNLKWWDVVVSTVTDVSDNESGRLLIAVSRDITKQKTAEQAVKRSEAELQILANSIQNLAWMADASGELFWLNQRWLEYTGRSLGEMQSQGWESLTHPQHAENVLSFLQSVWHKEEPWELTFQLLGKEGEYRWFLTRAFPIKNEEGQVTRWIGTHTDIDEQKSLEEKLEKLVGERTRELTRSNDDLQQFAHVISHDLKEPVRKIKTFGSRLNTDFGDLLPEKGKQYLQRMELSAERIYQMIDGVLLYSSFNAMELAPEQIDLNDTFRQLASDLEMLMEEKQALLQVGELPSITGSSVLIYQLFYNLVTNSLKFSMPERSPLIQVQAAVEKGFACITLRDNGIGFNASEAEKIFQTFVRLNPKDQYEGTGLGLALCKKIAERHKGLIQASGTQGEGAVFTVLLPLK